MQRLSSLSLVGLLTLAPSLAHAQQTPTPEAPSDTTASAQSAQSAGAAEAPTTENPPTSAPANAGASAQSSGASEGEDAEDARPSVQMHGTLEAAYGYNFNDPSNGLTAFRFYDQRHNLIGLQNALVATEWNAGPVSGVVQLQLGAFAELFWPGPRSVEIDVLWRLIQQATTEWHTPWRPLSLEGGVFNVPFGPEYNTAYLNWNWSGSNLFALMPYQVAGFRLNYDLGRGWTARAGVYNGWDQIVADNNNGKSVMASVEWEDPNDEENYATLNYMAGDERDRDDMRGPYWRHTFDLYGQWHPIERLYVRGHVFAGFEPNRDVMDGWFGAALYGKFDLHRAFSVALRGDVVRTFAGTTNLFHAETLALVGMGEDTSTLLGSGTLTLDYHPFRFASLRLEGRHDRASFPLFYQGQVRQTMPMDPGESPQDIPTAGEQTTLTLGLTTWF